MLDSLQPTATGLDGLPACFLRLSAPVFSSHAEFVNLSFGMSTVHADALEEGENMSSANNNQNQTSERISPDFCHCRPVEDHLEDVTSYTLNWTPLRLLDTPTSTLCFKDQYTFRPSGSTTAALVATECDESARD